MGTYSNVYVSDEALITARKTKFTTEELKEREKFKAEAKAKGFEVQDTEVSEPFMIVDNYLKAHSDDLGWWFIAEAVDEHCVSLKSVGESGKAYEIKRELKEFLDFLNENDLSLTTTVYRVGEGKEDAERYVIKDAKLVSEDKAKFIFPDGAGLEPPAA